MAARYDKEREFYDALVESEQHRAAGRFYTVNGPAVKSIHDWTAMFEKFWQHQLDHIKARAEAKARGDNAGPQPRKEK